VGCGSTGTVDEVPRPAPAAFGIAAFLTVSEFGLETQNDSKLVVHLFPFIS
jgi:hypothetical protein